MTRVVMAFLVGMVAGGSLSVFLNPTTDAEWDHDGTGSWDDLPLYGTDTIAENPPFAQLILERRPGLCPTCSSYRVVLSRNGAVQYEGRGVVERTGSHEGHISPWQFSMLAFAAERMDLMRLGSAVPEIDAPSTLITLVREEGDRGHEIERFTFQPPEFWVLGQAMDRVLETVQWQGPERR